MTKEKERIKNPLMKTLMLVKNFLMYNGVVAIIFGSISCMGIYFVILYFKELN